MIDMVLSYRHESRSIALLETSSIPETSSQVTLASLGIVLQTCGDSGIPETSPQDELALLGNAF
ncbi:MAG: hypothetical protein J6Y11_09255 [Paludibacteraceae bacterium]|nr:hypothetical protein [Paludibacteraceae bacterium]